MSRNSSEDRAQTPEALWKEEDLLEKERVRAMVLILRTSGCWWSKKKGCLMCGYNSASDGSIGLPDILAQLKVAINRYEGEKFVKIYTSGSFLDRNEIPAASTYTVTATSPSGSISPGGSPATSTITVAGSGGYTGSVTLSCSLTSSPTGASDLPGCTITTGSPVALSVGTTSGNATATVTTTAATADLIRLNLGLGKGWLGTGSGAVLAVLLFFGIPARRRSWRKLLCIMVAMAIIGTLSSCGGSNGGGGGGGGTGPTNPGTTAGTYTFTVTGSGNPAVTPAPSSTFTVSVN